ncbi:MAG: hypothetical protein II103_05535, partial [Treponema sp.]|nr:hypothetical protein [Treponema sp.]
MILKIKKKHSIKSSECFSLRRYGHFVDSHLIFVYTKYSVLAAAKNTPVLGLLAAKILRNEEFRN